jgi:hypothetical protein
LLYKVISIATFSNPFLYQIKTKTQQTQKQTPLWQGNKKPIVSNQTGRQTTMPSLNCGYFSSSNSSTTSLAQVNNTSSGSPVQMTLNSGPCHQVATMTSHAIPSPQTATPCHAAGAIQRSNFGRPSSAAARAACVRAGALQQSSPVAISRNAASPSQGARARAVSKYQSTSPANEASLKADIKLTNNLQESLTRAHSQNPTVDGGSAEAGYYPQQIQESGESWSLDRARSLDKKLSRMHF